MSQLNARVNSVQPDQIYFDITVSNFQQTTNPIPFYYTEARDNPFLMKPEDYTMSIIRFTVDTGEVPVFLPSIEPNQSNVDLTIYKITLEYTDPVSGDTYTQTEPMIWIPQDKSTRVPNPPNGTSNGLQDNSTGYYNCYSYNFLSVLIYATFGTCATNLLAQLATAGITNVQIPNYPVCYWDTTSQRLVLYFQTNVFNQNPADNQYILNPIGRAPGVSGSPIVVYFNTALFSLFNTFPAIFYEYQGDLNYQIGIVDVGGVNSTRLIPPQPSGGTSYYEVIQVFQEASTTALISPVQALVFTSGTLPIQANQVSNPVYYNNNQILGTVGGSNSATANIITDIVSDSGTYSPNLIYTPTAEFRRISLYGNTPLTQMDFQIFYRLRNGSLQPFYLQAGGSCTVKFLFEKK